MKKYFERIKQLEDNILISDDFSFDVVMKEVLSEATREELSVVVGYNREGEMVMESESKRMQEELIERTEIKIKQKRVVDKCQKQNMRH